MTRDAPFSVKGYVYILTNRAYPGVCKVGCTGRHPIIRARELSNTSCPYPFEVAWSAEVEDFPAVERAAHAALADWRINEHREFFGCEAGTARRAIEQAARPLLGQRLRLLAAAPRRGSARRGRGQPYGFGDFLTFVGIVGIVLAISVAVLKPAPATWWPPEARRAILGLERARAVAWSWR